MSSRKPIVDPLIVGRVVGDVLDLFNSSVSFKISYGSVVGDVLDFFNNSVNFKISYGSRNIINGCERKPSIVVNTPTVEIGEDDMRTFYTLVMVDHYAPSPSDPGLREYVHWLVTDVTGTTGPTYGHEIITYESPNPTVGIHRFVFTLFRQLGRDTIYAPGWHQNFSTRNFAELYNLGLPVASVFFNCQKENDSGGRRRSVD